MPGSTQPSLLSSDHPPTIRLELKVAANGAYVWGYLHITEHSSRVRSVRIPHTYLSGNFLSLPDDMRDVFSAWLYRDATEVIRVLRNAIKGWQDDSDQEGGHPAHNR